MTRMTFFCLAAVAMIGTACERHAASELSLGHEGGAEAAATETDLHRGTPPTPPEGASVAPAPTKEEAAVVPAPAASPAAKPPAGKFFPSNQ